MEITKRDLAKMWLMLLTGKDNTEKDVLARKNCAPRIVLEKQTCLIKLTQSEKDLECRHSIRAIEWLHMGIMPGTYLYLLLVFYYYLVLSKVGVK